MEKYDVIVVGAGPAGLVAAGRAGEKGAKVLVLEKNERPGKKLLITGKGRCNITNDATQSEFLKKIYPNGKYLKHAFHAFFNKDIVALIEANGTTTKVERGGRVFPESDKAIDVLNALMSFAQKSNVTFQYKSQLKQILVSEGKVTGVKVSVKGEEKIYHTNSIIVCAGGKSYPATGSTGEVYAIAEKLGHTIEPVFPSLVPVETKGDVAEKLMGLSLRNVKAIVWANGKKCKEDFGEMLFAHFGLTGPIILTLSRTVVEEVNKGSKVNITIDLKPALDEQKLDARLQRDLAANGKMRLANLFKDWLPGKLVPVFLDILNIDKTKEAHQVTGKERKAIRNLMKNMPFEVRGYRSFKEAIITAGGVSTTEVAAKTMQSKIVAGLFFAGEILNLDAETGGYNLQIAYSTGWLAGDSCI